MVVVPSFQPSTSFPQLCDKVTVDYDSRRGRFVKALENIPVGTVVCVEKGITVNVDPNKCYSCLDNTEEAGFAYCKDCEEFYEPESLACGEFDHLGIFKLAAHLVFSYPFSKIAQLVNTDDPEPPRSAPTSLTTSDIDAVLQLQPFREIGESFKLPPVQKAIKAILKSLDADVNWGRLDEQTRMVTFTKALRIMAERCAKNAHTIYSIEQKESKNEKVPMGTGMFPIASIFNHSCTPNVFAFFVNNTFIFVSRGVRAGDELVDSYGVTYAQHTFQERKDFLANVSGFECYCSSCEHKLSQDLLMEKNFNGMEKAIRQCTSFVDIDFYLPYLMPCSRDIEKVIIAFWEKEDSGIYSDRMFELWNSFIDGAKLRGIQHDPYLIRPYIELVILAYSLEAECSEEEKSSLLMVTHRLLQNFYADFHPLSTIVKNFVGVVANGDFNEIRSYCERMRCMAQILWKSDVVVDSDDEEEEEEDPEANKEN